MKFVLKEISIGEIVEGYVDHAEEGIIGYNGKLNIRPKYQREFVYNDVRRNAVIYSIRRGFPINVMYWVENAEGMYEILDGQQRTISICQYIAGDYPIIVAGQPKTFQNLTEEEQQQLLDYKLMIYFCDGNDKGKIDWFRIINITGEKLTDQELRNAIYAGEWLNCAKELFSKNNCKAYMLAKGYVDGSLIRQELLEKAISWISQGKIEKYMSDHQHDTDAEELWEYFKNVIEWVQRTFPGYRKEMKGLDWGAFYNRYKDEEFDVKALEKEIQILMMDIDVTDKKGIYQYVLSGDERCLNIRGFNNNQKRETYERQGGICAKCGNHFDMRQMDAEHVVTWKQGGKTNIKNCQMVCKTCLRGVRPQ